MSPEQIIEMAQGMPCLFNHIDSYAAWQWDEVVTFANEIARIEREECAKICEHNKIDIPEFTGDADTNRSLDFAAYCIRNKQ